MGRIAKIFYTINTRILLVLLVLFILITAIIGEVNERNIRRLYEESYTERLLLTNALMGSIIRSEDIEYFTKLLKNQGDDFRRKQVEFFHDREELFRLQSEGAPVEDQQEILDRLAEFHALTQSLKNDIYRQTLSELKQLKEISRSSYVYVMADIGLETRDGETLYTYIYDAEDSEEYSSPEMDGLGTSDTGNEAFTNVFTTKRQTEKAELYQGDFGELYFVCVPILNENGDVVAVLGTDLSLDDMYSAIESSTSLFNGIIITVFVLSVVVIFFLFSRSVGRPLSSLTQTALSFAEGNLHTPISKSALKRRTEIGTLAHAFKSTLDATTLYLDSVPESLIIMNRKGETLFRNEQFMKCLGNIQAREFMSALFPENEAGALEQSLNLDNSITVWIGEICFSVMLKEIVLSNMPENSILVIANDITDLMKEKDNAQAAAAAKSAFLSRMSHEMRTPMNAIIGMSQIAGESDSLDSIRYCVATIRSASEQLLNIINDVLDMSAIESGKLSLATAPVDIRKMLERVLGIFADAAGKKQQQLDLDINTGLDARYVVDELRLSQVLTNLLSNAVKFTPDGGTVTLRVDCAGSQENADLLRFTVSDTGIGMDETQLSRLFAAFEQADGGATRKYGGTGLGLAIAQSITEKMGGRIEAVSQPGQGAVFSFTLPLEREPADSGALAESGGADDDVPDLTGTRVLLAEDIEINREVFIALMEDTNITTDIAENGLEAVAKFREDPDRYDIILMDIQMPEMDGYEATRAIRATDTPRAAEIPIVAMSANAFQEDIDRCLECGMNDHLAKPIDKNAVILKIVRYTWK